MKLLTLSTLFLSLANISLAQLYATDIIEAIAPGSKECASGEDDCRTAEQAAPFIVEAMYHYGIFNTNEMAAVISLMAFESGDFRYKRNAFPGRPGQGTANMQMAPFNLKYAKQIHGVKEKLEGVETTDGMTDDQLNDLLGLVTPDEFNFGSGPWFLTTKCVDERAALKKSVDEGFRAYMACVGVDVTDDRLEYLTRAKKAFGISS